MTNAPNRLVIAAAVFACVAALGISYVLWMSRQADIKLDAIQKAHDEVTDIRLYVSRESVSQPYDALETSDRQLTDFSAAAAALDKTIDDLRNLRVMESDRVSALKELHDRYLRSVYAKARLVRAGNTLDAGLIGRTEVLPRLEALRDYVGDETEVIAGEHRRLNGAIDTLQRRLRLSLLLVSLLGLLVCIGGLLAALGMKRHLSLRAEVERLEKTVLIDGLTELGNNRRFFEDLRQRLAAAGRHGGPLSLAVIDVDRFKQINDSKGHAYGDSVLVAIGQCLRGMRAGDLLYRIGGDEFAVLIEDAPSNAFAAIQRLRELVAKNCSATTLSVGLADAESGIDDHDLFERADAALYEAKRRGRNGAVAYADVKACVHIVSTSQLSAFDRLLLGEGLTTAFQPIWDAKKMDLVGFEALARPDPRLGFAGPEDMLAVAERLHRVPELDCILVRNALRGAEGMPNDLSLFVNITPETVCHPTFDADVLVSAIAEAGLRPEQIVVEITEREVLLPSVLTQRVAKLHSLGLRVALDDAGAGFAGLQMLVAQPFDVVKIDRELMVRAAEERQARAVLAGILAFAHETHCFLIAEGIESVDQLAFVRHAHERLKIMQEVRGIQGYILGRPFEGTLLEALAAAGRSSNAMKVAS